MKTNTCVELLENFVFRTIRIQVGDVTNIQDAIAEAADLKVPLGEGLDVLDFQATTCENRTSKRLHPCVCVCVCPSIPGMCPAPTEPSGPHLQRDDLLSVVDTYAMVMPPISESLKRSRNVPLGLSLRIR